MATWAGYVRAVCGKLFVVKIDSKHRMVLEWVDQALINESKEGEEIKKKRVWERKRESWNTEEGRRERKWEANLIGGRKEREREIKQGNM